MARVQNEYWLAGIQCSSQSVFSPMCFPRTHCLKIVGLKVRVEKKRIKNAGWICFEGRPCIL